MLNRTIFTALLAARSRFWRSPYRRGASRGADSGAVVFSKSSPSSQRRKEPRANVETAATS